MIRNGVFVLLFGVLAVIGGAQSLSQTPDPATKFRLAQALEQSGEFEKAAGLYRELLESDPQNYVYFDAVQRVLVHLKRYDEAIATIRARLAANPRDLNLRGMLGTVYYRSGQEAEAKAQWDSALAIEPMNANEYRIIANVLIDNRLLDRAAEVYRRGRIACKDPNLFTLELAQLLAVTMDYAGATDEYIRWLLQTPAQLGYVQSRMAAFTWKENARSAATGAILRALEHHEDARLFELLGWAYLEGKDFPHAFDVYRRIDRITHAQGASLFAFAERAFKERAYRVAADAYQEALSAGLPAPRVPYARLGYADAMREMASVTDTLSVPISGILQRVTESKPRYEGAIAYYQKIIEDYPASEFSARAYYQIGRVLSEKYFDLDGALAAFSHVSEQVAGMKLIAYDVWLKMATIYVEKGDTARAAPLFQRVAAMPDALPDQSDEANFRLAELDYYGGKTAAALDRLGAITINLKADYANDALELQAFLEENSSTIPQALTEFARADFLAGQRKNTEAIAILRDLVSHYPGALLVDDALMKTAALQEAAGRYTEAVATYEELLDKYKENSTELDRAEFFMGEVFQFGLRDNARAIASYEKLLADFPRSVLSDLARKRVRLLRGELP
jgi:tetratricopeptide (TPR) repeat protein